MMFQRVQSLAAAVRARQEGVTLLAGGTNVVDLMQLGVVIPQRLALLEDVGLSEIEHRADGSVGIGALCQMSKVASDAGVATKFPAVSEAILSGASGQIRNMASVAGNLLQATRCVFFRDPFSDCNKRTPGSGCPAMDAPSRNFAIFGRSADCISVNPSDLAVALVAAGASLVVQGPERERILPVESLYTPSGSALHSDEVAVRIEIPSAAAATSSAYVKIRDRHSYAFALVSAAACLAVSAGKVTDCRMVLGGVAAKPWRCLDAEQSLIGKAAEIESYEASAATALRNAYLLGDSKAKAKLAEGALTEALIQAMRRLAREDRL